MSATRRISRFLGWIGIGCIAFSWVVVLVPKHYADLGGVLDRIGPLGMVIALGTVALPTIAAIRGSKRWLAVTAAGVITLGVLIGIALD